MTDFPEETGACRGSDSCFLLCGLNLPAASKQPGRFPAKYLLLWEDTCSSNPNCEQKEEGNPKSNFGVTVVKSMNLQFGQPGCSVGKQTFQVG